MNSSCLRRQLASGFPAAGFAGMEGVNPVDSRIADLTGGVLARRDHSPAARGQVRQPIEVLLQELTMATLLQDTRRWSVLMAVVLGLGVAWTFISRVPLAATTGGAPPPSPRSGFSAPDFTLDLLGGGQVTLSDLRGRVVMVNLWASWCPPCRAEMPAIEKVFQARQAEGLVVLGVNTTFQDTEADAAAFAREFGLTFPLPLDREGGVSRRYQLRGLPSTFFIDRRGVIRSVVIGGPMSEAVIQSKVEELLQESP